MADPIIEECTADKEEVDVWWGGYAGRTMLPSTLACVLITLALVGAAFVVVSMNSAAPVDARGVVYVLAGLLWAIQIARWIYRVGGYTYRLTNRRLYSHWGVWQPRTPPLELSQISNVTVEQSTVERLLHVGRIRLELADRSAMVLPGVRDPAHAADDIRRCVKGRVAASN